MWSVNNNIMHLLVLNIKDLLERKKIRWQLVFNVSSLVSLAVCQKICTLLRNGMLIWSPGALPAGWCWHDYILQK